MKKTIFLSILVLAMIISGCKQEHNKANFGEEQSVLIVNAGQDKNIAEGESVTLDGSLSNDSNGTIVQYTWSEGETIYCQDETPQCTISDLSNGSHNIILSVENEQGEIRTDDITVNVQVNIETLTQGNSSITGRVKDSVNGNFLENVIVRLYYNGMFVREVKTDVSGIYLFENLLAQSGYSIKTSIAGYLTANYLDIVIDNTNTVQYLQTVQQVDEQYVGTGSISGRITGSIDGIGRSGLTINFRRGINTHTGDIIKTITTGTDGYYSLSDLEAGSYTGEITGNGYQTSYLIVTVIGGETNENQIGTINPILESGEIRIVLTWGSSPYDLDSHLTGPIEDSNRRFHIYFGSKGYMTSSPYSNLDVDDTSSYGPETVTIREQKDGIYRYSVQNYSNKSSNSSTALANSEAIVKVYKGEGLVAQFPVPNQEGTLWTVFEIEGNDIRAINNMSYHSGVHDIQKQSYIKTDANLMRNLPSKN